MSEDVFNEVVGPLFMVLFGLATAGGFGWKWFRHRFNSINTATDNLVNDLETKERDSNNEVLVSWRKLFPMSKEMASEYAQKHGFEYIESVHPPGPPTEYLKFRYFGSESAYESEESQ